MLRLTLRNLAARKVRLAMSTLAIILGIGFLTGVLTFSSGLSATFDGIVKGSVPDASVRTAGTSESSGITTGQGGVTPALVDKVAALPEVAAADASVEGYGLFVLDSKGKAVGGTGAPTLSFNHTDSVNMLGQQILELDEGRWPAAPDEIALDTRTAERAGYDVGDTVEVIPPTTPEDAQGREDLVHELTLVGTANFNGGGTAGASLVFFDDEGAQQLFLGGADRYTSIQLTATEGTTQKQLVDAVSPLLPDGLEAVPGDTIVDESESVIGEMLTLITAFLVTFAVIAVVVGGFIIANTFSILVAQRVRELALLRALGASRRQVTRSVLVEALLMALLGATIGIVVGLGLARGLAAFFGLVGLEINSSVLNLTPGTVVAAYGVGIAITLASAYLPARRAAKVAPVQAMREDLQSTEGGLRRRTLVGTVAVLVGVGCAAVGLRGGPGPDAAWIGAAAVIWLICLAFLSPVVGKPVLVAMRGVFGALFRTPGRLAGDNALRNPRRTGATASALMVGLTLVSAVGVLAASLAAQTDKLVDDQFQSDYLVSGIGFGSFPTGIGDEMEQIGGVRTLSRQQFAVAKVDGEKEDTFLSAVDDAFDDVYTLDVVAGVQARTGHEAIVGESTAEDLGVGVGDQLSVKFPGKPATDLTVMGVYADSQVVAGLTVPLSLLEENGVQRVDSVLSILTDDSDASVQAVVRADLEKVVKDLPIVTVQNKEEYGESIRGQVNQMLYMIYGLLALSVVIAVIGIINTLSLSVIERTREIGLLRAVGLSRRKLRHMITLESVTIAVMGAVLGLALGVVIGALLQRALREDLTVLAIPWSSLAIFLAVAVVFGVLASIVPAIRASRMKVLDAIAHE